MPVPQDSTEWQSCLMVGQVRHRRFTLGRARTQLSAVYALY